ncbi:MurR/RpiR family transcriptional regulator [Pistricoccus aurantiacus]|uniref:MurR/RpiR family transcriptional regulator n=1 Tax=Pistricoccus aurantiacus TaxID=1883414 RepID=A0A5B8SVP1_9GAMM|nr:MurR/RpiR family transcriptional regulator [Pistricoccus aurantiacus]QEA39605.1 MurR/RpiR family transcriptional regulator [Pistricoccus aurantiacus]
MSSPHRSLEGINQSLTAGYAELSPQLKLAARYVQDFPLEIAFQSIRKSADAAGVTPSTLVRLAKRLGFESFDTFRDVFQAGVQEGTLHAEAVRLEGRASQLKRQTGDRDSLFNKIGETAFENIGRLFTPANRSKTQTAAQYLLQARQVAVLGFRDTFACAYHFAYMGRIAMPNLRLIRGLEGGLLTELASLDKNDVVVAFGFDPYCAETLRALRVAETADVQTIVITDSPRSPLAPGAAIHFNLSTATPNFFPSILAAITLGEAILAECIAQGPDTLVENIGSFEARMRDLGAYVETD